VTSGSKGLYNCLHPSKFPYVGSIVKAILDFDDESGATASESQKLS
jgi:hypothetical protein